LVADRAAGVVVVAGHVGEGDRVADRARRGVGADRAGEVQAGQALALDARGTARGRVAVAVVGHVVARDRDGRVGRVVLVADRAAGVVVVAGHVGEGDRVADRAGRGVRADRAGEVQASQVLALDARGRARGRVAVAVVGHVVAADADRGV